MDKQTVPTERPPPLPFNPLTLESFAHAVSIRQKAIVALPVSWYPKSMKTLTPGHLYELANFEHPNAPGQTLQFIEKTPVFDCQPGSEPLPTGALTTVNDGTTNEEVFRVLIDRMNFLQAKQPCRENAIAITHLETGLLWLEKRTADRKARGVEGKYAK